MDNQEKAADHVEYKPLHHSPDGTMINPCVSERKLLVSLMLILQTVLVPALFLS